MKRNGMKLLAALLALIFAATAFGAAAEQEDRRVETAEDAQEWVTLFLGDAPETLDSGWAMQEAMGNAVRSYGGMESLRKLQFGPLGAVLEIGAARGEESRGMMLYYVPCVFETQSMDLVLVIADGEIAGLITAPYSGPAPAEEAEEYDEIPLSLPVPSLGELPGTLTVPKGDGPFPAVILLQGSGPSDRDETVGSLKPFRDIADGLARHGIAVYRFDKRSYVYGAALAGDTQATLEDETIDDGVAAVQLVAAQERIDPGRIYVLGHSLGGNAIPAVARKLEQAPVKACGFIILAASPRPMWELMREQYTFLYSLAPEITPEMAEQRDATFAELDRLEDLDSLAEGDMVLGVYPAYWRWLADYDVLGEADRITEPVLLLQGEEDYQVTMEDFALWQEAVGGKSNWRLVSCPGLTHAFVPGEKMEGTAVYAREEHVSEDVISEITAFVHKTGTAGQ